MAIPGDRVIADLLDGDVRVIGTLALSNERQPPVCRHFGSCGGCTVQHLDPGLYRTWKRSLLHSQLQRCGIDFDPPPLIDAHGAGRRRATFHVRRRNGDAAVGFMAARSHHLIAVEACPVLAPELASAPQWLEALGSAFIAVEPAFDVVVTATATGIDCALRGMRERRHTLTRDVVRLLERFGVIRLAVNGEILMELAKPVIACGRALVPLPPGGFIQATALAEDMLCHHALAGAVRARRVLDLFCGIGAFTLRMAGDRPVTAIDSDASALAALDFAARRTSGLKPVAIERRDLFRIPLTARELDPYDAVIFDPPRRGAAAQAHALARSAVKTVIAVSCDAATFARDAATLVESGYRLTRLIAIDQFRWSPHIEIASTFERV
jgi:23S rRNA (uracil1939-C5)-methyltransferase